MHIIATAPELYHIVVELNTVQSLLQLLSHDNTGISDLFKKILCYCNGYFFEYRIIDHYYADMPVC